MLYKQLKPYKLPNQYLANDFNIIHTNINMNSQLSVFNLRF